MPDGIVLRHDLQAERAVLAGLRIVPATMDSVLEIISAKDFYRDAHRKIFSVLVELHKEGEAIDLVMIVSRLQSMGILEDVGGIAYISSLSTPSAHGILSHAQIIADCSQARRVTELAQELAMATATDTPAAVFKAAAKLAKEAEPRRARRSDFAATAMVEEFLHEWDEAREGRQILSAPIPTPWPSLTDMLDGGWTGGGRPYYFGARKKVGKTSCAYEIAVDAATRQGKNVLFFELEIGKQELRDRMLAGYAEVEYQKFRLKRFDDWETHRIVRAAEHIHCPNLRIDATRLDRTTRGVEQVRGSKSVEDIRRTIQRMQAEMPVDLVVLDHLQHIEPPFRGKIFDRVTYATQSIAALTQETGIPFVVMVQLNDSDGAPGTKDVRGSQDIGNDCEALILLDRPPMRRSKEERAKMSQMELEEAEIIVALHGSGSTGTIPMRYVGKWMRWYPIEPKESQGDMFSYRQGAGHG